jgi:hypothetical protein
VRILLSVLFLLIGAAICAPGHATTVLPLSDQALANGAEMIVRGRVTAVEVVEFDVGPGVFTDVTFQVDERLDGSVTLPEVTLRIPGGRTNDHHIVIEGMPEFEVGQELIIFLETLPLAFGDSEIVFIPHGLSQGVWSESEPGWLRGEQSGLLPVAGVLPDRSPLGLEELRQLVSP